MAGRPRRLGRARRRRRGAVARPGRPRRARPGRGAAPGPRGPLRRRRPHPARAGRWRRSSGCSRCRRTPSSAGSRRCGATRASARPRPGRWSASSPASRSRSRRGSRGWWPGRATSGGVLIAVMLLYPVAYLGLVVAPHALAVLWALVLGAATTTFPMVLTLIGLRAAHPRGHRGAVQLHPVDRLPAGRARPVRRRRPARGERRLDGPAAGARGAHRADARARRLRGATSQYVEDQLAPDEPRRIRALTPLLCGHERRADPASPRATSPCPGPSRRPTRRPPPPVNPYETPAAPPPPPPARRRRRPLRAAAGRPAAVRRPARRLRRRPPLRPTPSRGQPQYGAPTAEPEPSKAMAITALIASLLCCIPARLHPRPSSCWSRSKDGRNHGRAWRSAPSSSRSSSRSAWRGRRYRPHARSTGTSLAARSSNLKTGECFNASNLADDDEDFVEDIERGALRRAARRRGAGHQGPDPGRRRGLRPLVQHVCAPT